MTAHTRDVCPLDERWQPERCQAADAQAEKGHRLGCQWLEHTKEHLLNTNSSATRQLPKHTCITPSASTKLKLNIVNCNMAHYAWHSAALHGCCCHLRILLLRATTRCSTATCCAAAPAALGPVHQGVVQEGLSTRHKGGLVVTQHLIDQCGGGRGRVRAGGLSAVPTCAVRRHISLDRF
jgi:hypothetical protein